MASLVWVLFVGSAPFAVVSLFFLYGDTHIWLGDLRVAVFFWLLCFVVTMIATMDATNSVHVFSVAAYSNWKDRALERDRPHLRKKESVCLSIHPSIYLSIYLSINLSINQPICLSLSLSLSLCLSVCLSTCLSASLKTSNSARRPHFST